MNGGRDMSARPFAFFTNVHQDQRLAGIHFLFYFAVVFFFDSFLCVFDEFQETFGVVHRFLSLDRQSNRNESWDVAHRNYFPRRILITSCRASYSLSWYRRARGRGACARFPSLL